MTSGIAKAASGGLPYRKDIDGLRFFAIVPVVLYHAFGNYMPSGFVGVDIFFAISGYLIGGIIYREANSGKFSFLNFYARRARRILPALLVVVVFTVLTGFLFLNTDEMTLLLGAGQWTILGISNIFFFRFIDYFAPDASSNPLLMTWSLGIEEQFYIVFPVVLLALRSLRRRFVLLGLMVLVALSFAASIYFAIAYPLAGFYLLPARAWELGAGAALAIVHSELPRERRPGAASDGLAVAGLAIILISCWIFSEETPFPGYAALLPICGTLLLLHTADSRINRSLLTAPLFTGIGLISYSWYLWHWPLMAFVRVSANGTPTLAAMLVVVILSLGLAVASWRFVEQPLRHGTLPSESILVRYVGIIAALLVILGWIKHEDTFTARRLPLAVLKIERSQAGRSADQECMASFGDTQLPKEELCNPRGATVALLGDSHANHLAPGLRRYLDRQGSKLVAITKASCPPLLGFSHLDKLNPTNLTECAQFQRRAVERLVRDPSIRTVVVAAYLGRPGSRSEFRIDENGFTLVPIELAFGRGMRAMASTLQRSGKRVVIVLDAPKYDQDIYKYMLSEAIPLRRELGQWTSAKPRPRSDVAATAPMRKVVASAVRDVPNVTIIDLAEQFCTAGRCRYSADGVPLYIDAHHLSVVGSRRVRWEGLPIDD